MNGTTQKFTDYEELQVERISQAIVERVLSQSCAAKHNRIWTTIGLVGLIACYGAGIRTIELVVELAKKYIS